MGAGLMHTGYYFGFFLAAIANYFIGSNFGWRAMFAVGGTPAILVAFIYYRVKESSRWQSKRREVGKECTAGRAFLSIFSRQYRCRTILNSVYILVSIAGLWAGSVYVPASVTFLAATSGIPEARGGRLANYATMLLSLGTILGCLILPILAERLGRRVTLGVYFILMFVFISVGFGYAFYMTHRAMFWFMVCLFFLGVGGGNFAMYTLWLPEQYPTECRGSAFAFTTSVGRFVGAAITFLVGAGVRHFHTIGTPVALTSIAFIVGLFLLPFGQETKGEPLPV
jgi:MFS family permease